MMPVKAAEVNTGDRFGRLTVIELSHTNQCRQRFYKCRCDCGEERLVIYGNLSNGNTSSCGCFQREAASIGNITHGHTTGKRFSGTFNSWRAMRERCYNPKTKYFHNYGGRGIQVCERWLNSFENFLDDMGERPAVRGWSIERKENSGNYEPGNCIWTTQKRQMRNMRRNHILTFNYKSQCIAEWTEELGFETGVLEYRINAGWDTERALTTPSRRRRMVD